MSYVSISICMYYNVRTYIYMYYNTYMSKNVSDIVYIIMCIYIYIHHHVYIYNYLIIFVKKHIQYVHI